MEKVLKGFKAGVFATLVIFILLMVQAGTRSVPEFHIVRTLSEVLGFPDNPFIGIAAVLFIGTVVLGGLYSQVADHLPSRSPAATGALFGLGSWLVMMLVYMPLVGAGVFGLGRGTIMVALITLAMHLIFGVAMGKTYAAAKGEDSAGARRQTTT